MVVAQLPSGDEETPVGWSIALVSDDTAEVAISEADGTLQLPPRSVVVLAQASPTA